MKMKRLLKKKIIIVIPISLILLIVMSGTGIVNAIWDSERAVHVKASDIENSTLVIGTHLIHLSALTDELYEIAYQSAADSGQMELYYKSELADGVWIELGNAASVLDLTNAGNQAVSEEVIQQLYFEYHTKSDGVTYDLRTNQPICLYDIINPYDLEAMEELEPLENQYQMVGEQAKSNKPLKLVQNKISDFFANEVEDEYTETWDKQIEALNRYLQILIENNGSDGAKEVVNRIMSKVDSARRAYVLEKVSGWLDDLSEDLNSMSGEEEEEENAPSVSDPLTAVYSSVENVENSYIEQSGNQLSRGVTVLSEAEYEEAMNLIQHAMEYMDSECDTDADNLSVIYNVNDGVIVNSSYELTYLTDNLTKRGETAFKNLLAAGINDEYKAELQKNSSRAILNRIIADNTSKISGIKSELEFIIEAVLERCDSKAGIDFITVKLNEIGVYNSVIPADAFEEGALEEVEDYQRWLAEKLKELNAGLAGEEDELSKLYEEKQDLQEKKMEALDKNDLDEANRIDTLIAVNDEKIDELEGILSDEINELTSRIAELQQQLDKLKEGDESGTETVRNQLEQQIAESETRLAAAEAQTTEGSRVSAIAELKKSVMESIAAVKSGDSMEESTAVIESALEGLEIFFDTNPKQVYNALQAIYSSFITEKYLNESDNYDEMIQEIERFILDNADRISGIEDHNMVLSSEELDALLEDMKDRMSAGERLFDNSNTDISSLESEEIQSALLAGLAQYAECVEDNEIDHALAVYAKKLFNSGNERVFETVTGTGEVEYVSVKTLAVISGYRYIWNDSFKTATLALGTKYYAFTAFSDRVLRSSDTEEYDILSHANEFKKVVYIDNDYAYQEFGYEAYYLGDTEYAVLVNDEILELAAEICDVLINENGKGN